MSDCSCRSLNSWTKTRKRASRMGGPICGLVNLPLARWWVVHVLHESSCACQIAHTTCMTQRKISPCIVRAYTIHWFAVSVFRRAQWADRVRLWHQHLLRLRSADPASSCAVAASSRHAAARRRSAGVRHAARRSALHRAAAPPSGAAGPPSPQQIDASMCNATTDAAVALPPVP